jgi:hypothetical protein
MAKLRAAVDPGALLQLDDLDPTRRRLPEHGDPAHARPLKSRQPGATIDQQPADVRLAANTGAIRLRR